MNDEIVVVLADRMPKTKSRSLMSRPSPNDRMNWSDEEIEQFARFRAYNSFRMAENYRGMMLWRYWPMWIMLILAFVLIAAAAIVVMFWAEPGSLACSMNPDLPFCQHAKHALKLVRFK